jgi:uncharacterized membrane protein YfcA
VLPRPGRAHDQLLRATIVAGIGGVVIGHILWLIAITVAISTTRVNFWVLVVAAGIAVASAAALVASWRLHRRKSYVWSTFLWCLPISPIAFTLAVLADTYL